MMMAGGSLGLGFGGNSGIAMTMAGGGLGLGFGGDSSQSQPPTAAAAKRWRCMRWEREGGQRQQPMNGGAQQCHTTNQQMEGCNERQRHWLRGGGRQTSNTTTND